MSKDNVRTPRECVETKEHPEYPLRRIAKILGVNVSTISHWGNECPVVARATTGHYEGSDGKTYKGSNDELYTRFEDIKKNL